MPSDAATAVEVLTWAVETFGASFAIATGSQKEGMVVVDLASKISQGVRIFTLDTGRSPQETFQIMDVVRERYGAVVEILRRVSFA